MPWSTGELEEFGAKLCLSEEPVELADGVVATGTVPRETSFELPDRRFRAIRNGEMVVDGMPDDQSVVVTSSEGPVLIAGCAHSGIVNTLRYAAKLVGSERFHAIVGGLHLRDADDETIERVCDELERRKVQIVAACHCTGIRAIAAFVRRFGDRFVQNTAGTRLEF